MLGFVVECQQLGSIFKAGAICWMSGGRQLPPGDQSFLGLAEVCADMPGTTVDGRAGEQHVAL